MPSRPSSAASVRVAISSAALAAAYEPSPGCGSRVAIEPIITTRPPPRARIDGRQARVRCSAPKKLVAMASCQPARSARSKVVRGPNAAALFTAMSTPPSSSIARRTRRSQSCTRDTSVGSQTARRPSFSTSAATDASVPSLRAASATSAPSRASASAIERPSPGPMPETTATRPARSTSGERDRRVRDDDRAVALLRLGLEQDLLALAPPLGQVRLARIRHAAEARVVALDLGHVAAEHRVAHGFAGDPVGAQAVDDRAVEAAALGELGIAVQRVLVAVEPVEQSLLRQ